MKFEEAQRLFKERTTGSNSVLLEPNVRLVQVSPNRFGIQYFNTYIVRILEEGYFILNSAGRNDEATMNTISKYAPVQLVRVSGSWKLPDGSSFHDFMIVDQKGAVIKTGEKG